MAVNYKDHSYTIHATANFCSFLCEWKSSKPLLTASGFSLFFHVRGYGHISLSFVPQQFNACIATVRVWAYTLVAHTKRVGWYWTSVQFCRLLPANSRFNQISFFQFKSDIICTTLEWDVPSTVNGVNTRSDHIPMKFRRKDYFFLCSTIAVVQWVQEKRRKILFSLQICTFRIFHFVSQIEHQWVIKLLCFQQHIIFLRFSFDFFFFG